MYMYVCSWEKTVYQLERRSYWFYFWGESIIREVSVLSFQMWSVIVESTYAELVCLYLCVCAYMYSFVFMFWLSVCLFVVAVTMHHFWQLHADMMWYIG